MSTDSSTAQDCPDVPDSATDLATTPAPDMHGGVPKPSCQWRLSPLQLASTRQELGLGPLVAPLNDPSFGDTDELRRLGLAESTRMAAAGLRTDEGEIEPALASALRVLASPVRWGESLWFPAARQAHPWGAVAAAAEDDQLVLAVQEPSDNPTVGGAVTVEVPESGSLTQVLLATLPPAPPGYQGPVGVPARSLRAADRRRGHVVRPRWRGSIPRRASGDRRVELYCAIGQAKRARLGEIAVNVRDQYGRHRRSRVLHWFDNVEPDGRYLNHTMRGSTGEHVYLLSPADTRLMAAQIDTLLAEVGHQA